VSVALCHPNDISVVITSPVSGLRRGLRVPAFAMYGQNWLATLDGRRTECVTERGQRVAEDLLRELYEFSRGKRLEWTVETFGAEGAIWIEGD